MFWHGNDPEGLVRIGNVSDATAKERYSAWPSTISSRDGHAFTTSVGEFLASPFGLYDMQGNVSEWCADWYSATYYGESPRNDPSG